MNTFIHHGSQLLVKTGLFIAFCWACGPVQAQTVEQAFKAVASDREERAEFGYDVSVSGDYALVGSPKNESGGGAYLFKRTNGNWAFYQKLVSSDLAPGDSFGNSVCISGEYALVGAQGKSGGGAAYIFRLEGDGVWRQQQKLAPSDRSYFGTSVSLSGDYALIGDRLNLYDASGGNQKGDAGSAYIYKLTDDTWTFQQKLVASDRANFDNFGTCVSLKGEYALIGAYGKAGGGAAYIFKRNGDTWAQHQKLLSSDLANNDNFGISVSLNDDYAFVGAPSEDEDASGANTRSSAGSVYVFGLNSGTWVQQQKLVASDRDAGDRFGFNVALDGGYAVIMADHEKEDTSGGNTLNQAGSAYVFRRNGSTWTQMQKIVASDRATNDQFGCGRAISNGDIVVGARTSSLDASGDNYLGGAGSAYIYRITSMANNVILSGTPDVGETLTGSYNFIAALPGGSEGSSVYRWYRSDDASGANKTLISGASAISYLPTAEDLGKHISYTITPVDDKSHAGATVESNLVGPVKADPVFSGTGDITRAYGDADFVPEITSTSDGEITYSSSNKDVAVINGNTVTIAGLGTTLITATQAAGTYYYPGSVSITLTVNKGDPALAGFDDLTKTFGDAEFTLASPISNSEGIFSYTSSDENVATITDSTVTLTGAGSTTITATQEATAHYNAGSISLILTVNKADISGVTFTDSSFVYNGTPRSLTITGTLPDGTSVEYTNNQRTLTGSQTAEAKITGKNHKPLELTAELEVTPMAFEFHVKSSTSPQTCSGSEGSITFESNLPAGTYLMDYDNGTAVQKEVTVTANGEFMLSGLIAGTYYGFSIDDPARGSGTSEDTLTLSGPEPATLTLGTAVNPTASSTNSGRIAFTTTLADGNYTLSYLRAAVAQTRPVTVESGAFTLTGLNASTYSGVNYSDFSITDPVSACTAVAAGTVTLGNSPTLTGLSNGAHEPAGTIYVRTANSAYVRGTINAGSAPATGTLIYGTDPALSSGITTRYLGITGAGVGVGYVPQITGLTQNTTYYFKFTASSVYGAVESTIRSFRTRSTNANLTSLVPGKGSLSPSFKSNSSNYTVTLAHSETSITFTATAAPYATMKLNGTSLSGGSESAEITLSPGENTVSIVVSAEAGNTKTYTIKVIRKQTQTITFPPLGVLVYGSPNPVLNGTASSGLAVSYSTSDNNVAHDYSSGSTRMLNLRNTGTVTITASQAGNSSYEAAENVEQVLIILPATFTGVSFTDTSFVYDGTQKELLIKGELPEGTSVQYTRNQRTHTGDQEATALITRANYDTLRLEARLKITPLNMVFSVKENMHPAICSGTDGSITFESNLPFGGYPLSYTHNGYPADTVITVATSGEFTISGLTAGIYKDFSITADTAGTGSTSEIVTLNDPLTPVLTLENSENPSLCLGTDGSIAFTTNLEDGTYTLNYMKDGASVTTEIIVIDGKFPLSGLPAGTYSIFSITIRGCTGSETGPVTLSDPKTPTLTLDDFQNPITCEGTNGNIAFSTNLEDGTYTLNYTKSGASATEEITVTTGKFNLNNLSAGNYSAFSITSKGCTGTATGSVTLSDPDAPTLTLTDSQNPTTCEGTNGNIAFSTNLEDGTYTLNYTKGGASATEEITVTTGKFNLNNLSAGNYSAFSIISKGCTGTATGSISLSDPNAPTITLADSQNPTTCEGTNGKIAFSTSLEDGTYTLNYTKGGLAATEEITVTTGKFTLNNLSAGNYSAFSITSKGCTGTATGSVTLSDPDAPTITLGDSQNPTTCEGTNGRISFSTNLEDGTYTLNYTKANSPLTAEVTVTSGKFTLPELAAGAYSAFSIISKGCTGTATGSISLSDPDAPTLTLTGSQNPTTCEGTNGKISFSTSLEDGTYTLNYTKGEASGTSEITVTSGKFTLSNLSAGTYSIFSIFISGCTGSVSGPVTLSNPDVPILTPGNSQNPSACEGTNGSISISTNLDNGTYTLNYAKGGTPLSAEIRVASGKFTLGNLSAGNYTGFSVTSKGCTGTAPDTILLRDPAPLTATITPSGPTELCEDDKVTLTSTAAGTYLWSTGQTTRSITVDKGGIYTVKITSAAGCSSEAQITVTQKTCNIPPMAVCKPHVVLVVNDHCYATLQPEDLDAGSYDSNDDWFNRSIDIHPNLTVGTYTATFTVVDIRGASTSCQSRVDVVDHTPPVALAHDLTLALDQNGNASLAVSNVDAGSKDNCGPLNMSLDRTHFTCSDLGLHRVTLTVTDPSGNTSTALANITIVDNQPPKVETRAITLTLDENGNASLTARQLATSISDNCGIWDVRVSQSQFSCEHAGLNRVILTVEDVQGNTTSDTVSVTVVDHTPPVISARSAVLYLDSAGKTALDHTQIALTITDNCTVDSIQLSRTDFTCEDQGEHSVRITATDANGNRSDTTVSVIVADTISPRVITRDVVLYLDASGRTTLTPELADNGSSDNCGIISRELERTSFGCVDTGQHTVSFTLTDAAGNRASASLLVSVRDTLPPIARAQNIILELSEAGTVSLTPEEVNNASSDNCNIASMTLSQTFFSCQDLGNRLVTLTVTDDNGNSATAKSEILIRDPQGVCPCSYGVLANDRIVMRNNEVFAGGIGVTSSKGKVKLRNTEVNRESTFVKAPYTRFDTESESSTYLRGQAPQPETFRKNPAREKGKEKVGKGENKTLAAGRYGKIKVMKEAGLNFSGGEVYIRRLIVKKKAKITFSEPAVLLVRDQVRLASSVEFNSSGETVRLYAGKRVSIGNGSEVKGYLHTGGVLKTSGGSEETRLEGFFAAERLRAGRNTQWSGGGVLCRENEQPQQGAGKERLNLVTKSEKEEAPVAEPEIRLSVSPNPASDYVRAEVFCPSGKGELSLTDMLGNVLIRKTISTVQSVQNLEIQSLMPGIYIIRVTDGNQVKTVRLLKEKF